MAYTTINKSTDYFNTILYTGTGSAQSLTGVGFQPDLVWCKDRTNSYDHVWFDAVRGATKRIRSNENAAETTASTDLTAFDSDGFTVGSGSNINNSGNNFVSWNWKANGQGSSNTDGSINTTYTSVNTTAGFSISTYTGTGSAATIGHGLGVAPDLVIIKSLDQTRIWIVGVEALGNWNKYLALSATDAEQTSSTYFPSAPTSTLVNLGDGANVNNSSEKYVAYCFAEKKGFSKVGSYTGNGNADGPFVYTGFKPAFVLVKNASTSNNWFLQDSKRLGYNGANHLQKPNTSGADDTGTHIDMLSNGFKTIVSSANCNGSGNTMIYVAFAEEPLVGSNNIPATAR